MEEILNGAHGIPAICVLLALHLVFKIGEFAWSLKREKEKVSERSLQKHGVLLDANTRAIQKLEAKLERVELILLEVPKYKLDMRRVWFVTKRLAGAKWPDIRQEMMNETSDVGL